MNDSMLTIWLLVGLLILLTCLLALVVILGSRLLVRLLTDQTVEAQRLRNQILAMGNLDVLERLNRTTEVSRNQSQPSDSDEQRFVTGINPQDVISTPDGPVVIVDGQPIPLSQLDPTFLAQGWGEDDVDFNVSPEGRYVAGATD